MARISFLPLSSLVKGISSTFKTPQMLPLSPVGLGLVEMRSQFRVIAHTALLPQLVRNSFMEKLLIKEGTKESMTRAGVVKSCLFPSS